MRLKARMNRRFLLRLDSSETPGASRAADEHGRRDGVSESSFICAVGEPEAFFGPGTPLHFGKQWVMIIVAYREEIQLYCFNAAACLQEPPSSVRAELDSLCFCVQITHFVCIFSIFLLCYSVSALCWREDIQCLCGLQLGFITRLLPHPLISNKHTRYVQ